MVSWAWDFGLNWKTNATIKKAYFENWKVSKVCKHELLCNWSNGKNGGNDKIGNKAKYFDKIMKEAVKANKARKSWDRERRAQEEEDKTDDEEENEV